MCNFKHFFKKIWLKFHIKNTIESCKKKIYNILLRPFKFEEFAK